MNKAITRVIILFTLSIVPLPLLSQILITPTLISAQSGTSLYCAAKYTNPQVQVYCFTTVVTKWDKLVYNQIIYASKNNAVVADYHQNYNQSTNRNFVTFFFYRGLDNILNWQMTINGLPMRSGTF